MGIREVNLNLQNQNVADQTQTKTENLQKMADQLQKTASFNKESIDVLMNKNSEARGTAIVSNAVAAFAKSTLGEMFNKSKTVKIDSGEKEISENEYLNQGGDTAILSEHSKIKRSEKEMLLQRGLKEHADKTKQSLDKETQSLLQDYSKLYGRVITSQSGAAAANLDKLEKQLKEKGYSNNQLMELKLNIKLSLRGAAMQQIKDAFLKRFLSMDSVVEMGTAERGLNDLVDQLLASPEFGAEDFGGYKFGLQGAVNQASEDVAREIRIALKDVFDQKMTERLVSNNVDPEKARKELETYLKVGAKVGFNASEYMASWAQEKINQGLFIYRPPEVPTMLGNQLAADQQKQQEKEDNLDQPEEENEEFLVNRLRALYLRKALKDDFFTSLNTDLKIQRTKQKMIKLQIYSNDVNDKVKKEAELIAGAKIMQMFQEAFIERATLYRLSGPAYRLVDAKITGLMKNAQKLGMEISEYEFNLIRDRANQTVFDVSKRELQLTQLSLSVKESPYHRDKKQKLIKLLKRLKEESAIQDELGVDENSQGDQVKISA